MASNGKNLPKDIELTRRDKSKKGLQEFAQRSAKKEDKSALRQDNFTGVISKQKEKAGKTFLRSPETAYHPCKRGALEKEKTPEGEDFPSTGKGGTR